MSPYFHFMTITFSITIVSPHKADYPGPTIGFKCSMHGLVSLKNQYSLRTATWLHKTHISDHSTPTLQMMAIQALIHPFVCHNSKPVFPLSRRRDRAFVNIHC